MYQYQLSGCNKPTTPTEFITGKQGGEGRLYGNSLYSLHNFSVNLKLF